MSGAAVRRAGGVRAQGVVLTATLTIFLSACASVPRATPAASSVTASRRFEGCVHYNRWPRYPAFDVDRVFLGGHVLIPAAALDTVDLNDFAGRNVRLSANVRGGTDTLEVTQIEAVPGESCRILH